MEEPEYQSSKILAIAQCNMRNLASRYGPKLSKSEERHRYVVDEDTI